ncbi:MAG: hypothetical protein HZA34_03995 [Candidatus Pacebacteria bacterium]|nr:hypothetical protein [Candidatus Paceibacterota bacterium]
MTTIDLEPSTRGELEGTLKALGVPTEVNIGTIRGIEKNLLEQALEAISFYFAWGSEKPEDTKFNQYAMQIEEEIERILGKQEVVQA